MTSLLDSKLFLRNRVSSFVPFRLIVGAYANLLSRRLSICIFYSCKWTCCVGESSINETVGARPRENEADLRGSFCSLEVELFDIT